MDSMQIAAMTGSFNQQVMMGMQHSAMISQQFGGYAPMPGMQPVPTQGEQFGGMLLNAFGNMGMGAMANPRVNSFGGGMLQPFTMTGQHLVGQAMYGMNQQQMLDASMRQSYRFMNDFGGRGFTQGEMGGMGQDLRAMAMQRGPGGQTTTFEELGRLASNMGRMGMAEGVRSVKDFNEKFKQMLTSVKTIAEELGTSLEEAQKVMASMKGAGVFRNQGQFAANIRTGAVAGNLATSELSSMALIGSQISRSVGGLGSAGARAGVEAITNIGAARQAGIINEEDIYNVTGLTGAEGRRAFAQMNLSGDAQFFRSGLGRRALAAMAGKNGQLDQGDVEAFMSGGVGTGQTMQMAYQNLGQVGRANFIRNEGRLRGEAMAAFGGLGKAVVARDWLEERGMDLNEMNDRNMLFFQRKFGVGRDEADQLIKMARNLEGIMAERRQAQENDQYARMLEQSQRQQSPQELIKRAQMGRQAINDRIRQFGADVYKGFGVQIGEMLESGLGGFQDRRRADLAPEISRLYAGGGAATETLRQLGTAPMTALEQRHFDRLFGGGVGMPQGAQFERFMGGQGARLRELGVDPRQIRNAGEYTQMQRRLYGMERAAAEGGSEFFAYGTREGAAPQDARQRLQASLDDSTRNQLRAEIGANGLQGRNEEFLRSLERGLNRLDTEKGKELAKAFREANQEERARMATDVLKAIGMEGLGRGRFGGDTTNLQIGGGRFATRERELLEVGRGLTGGLSGVGGQGPGYAQQAEDFIEDARRVFGGGGTVAGRLIGARPLQIQGGLGRAARAVAGIPEAAGSPLDPLGAVLGGAGQKLQGFMGIGQDTPGLLDRSLAWAKGAEQKIRDSREDIARELTPTGVTRWGLERGGRALDWVTGRRTKGWAEKYVGTGGITGKGGLIERFRKTELGRAIDEPFSDATREALGGAGVDESTMVAEYLRSREGRSWQQRILGGTEEGARDARLEMEQRRGELASRKRTAPEQAEFRALQGIEAAAALKKLPANATEKQKADLARSIYGDELKGKSDAEAVKQLEGAAGTVGADWNMQQQARLAQDMAGIGERARAEDAKITAIQGSADYKKLVREGKISESTMQIMQAMDRRRGKLVGFYGHAAESELGVYRGEQATMADIEERFAGMSVQEKQKAAKELSLGGHSGLAATARREASIERRLTRAGGVGGEREARDIAGMLGATFKKGEFQDVAGAQGRAAAIVERMGVTGAGTEAMQKELSQILSGKRETRDEAGNIRVQEMTRGQRAQALRQFQETHGKEIQEAAQKRQDDPAAQNDPSFRQLQTMAKATDKIATSTEGLKPALDSVGTKIVEALGKVTITEGKKEQ